MDHPLDITGFSNDATAHAPQHAPTIDGYELLDQLGQGGMGTVWRALQLSTRRQVAIKIVSSGLVHSKNAIGRFEREVELTSRLQHANIARIYDSGLRQNIYFYAMELIEGERLDAYVKHRKLETREILQLMRVVVLAVQHAHQHGVVHRDLKPANILVGEDGQPHLLDFGLAKSLVDLTQAEVSIDDQVLGTLEFMSPEQADGRLDRLDTRTDVYSLGATLFFLLTGQPPHEKNGTRLECLRRIVEQEPRRPRSVAPWIDSDLEALLVKALARQPDDRYPSAAEFAGDIQNYLNGDPLTARPTTTWYFLRKRMRKHRLPISAVTVVLTIVFGLAIYSYVRISTEKREAQNQAAIAEAVNDFLGDMLSSADPNLMLGGDKITVVQAIEQAMRKLDAGALKDQPLTEASVRFTIATTFGQLSRNREAEENFRKSLALRQAFLPPLHRDIAFTMEKLGSVLNSEGRPAESESILREALALRYKVLDPEYSVEYANALSTTLLSEKKLSEAEQIDRANLAIVRRIATKDMQPWVADEMRHLASGLRIQGKLTEAEMLLRQALEINQRSLPADHPNLSGCMSALAEVLQREGKLDEAEALLRDALARGRKTLPAAHGLLIGYLQTLAIVVRKQRKLGEAESLFREAVEMSRKLNDTNTPRYPAILEEFANVLRSEKKSGEAVTAYREAFEVGCKDYPPGAPRISQTLSSLAKMLDAAGKTEEIAKLCDGPAQAYRQAFAAQRATEKDDAATVEAINLQANTFDLAGKYADAEALYRDEAATADKVLGEESLEARSARAHLADELIKQQKFVEAERMLLANFHVMSARNPATSILAIDRLIHLYQVWDRPDQLEIWQSIRRRPRPSTARTATKPS